MAVQNRYSAVQGEVVRLYRRFLSSGVPVILPAAPVVEIKSSDGLTVLETITATQEYIGTWYVDYGVPLDLTTGQYYDSWSWQYQGTDPVLSAMTSFEVYNRDTIVNFTASSLSQKITVRVAELLRNLDNDFIYEATHIPIYWEQMMRTSDPKRFNAAYKNWNKDPKPMVRVGDMLVDSGWYTDYDGNIFFEGDVPDADHISVSYNFSWFSQEELISFLNAAMGQLNALPPAENYRTVDNTPPYWDYGIILGAAIHALRRIVLGMQFQERAIIFAEDGSEGGGGVSSKQSVFESLYKDYQAVWDEMAAGIKKALPGAGFIVTPEYTLPGGRARWFRYLFTTNA